MRDGHHHAEGGDGEGEQQQQAEQAEEQHRVVGHVDEAGERQQDHALRAPRSSRRPGTCRRRSTTGGPARPASPAGTRARGPITSETALNIALNTTAMQRTPGKMNVLRSTPSVEAADSDCRPDPSTNRNSSGWISHRHDLHAVGGEADQVAPPDDPHRPDLRPPGALAAPGRRRRRRSGGAHRLAPAIARIIARLRSPGPPVSASRIVEPV